MSLARQASTSNEPILEWNLLEGTNDEEEIFLETGNLMESSNYDKVLGTLEKNLLEDGKLEGIQCQFLDKHRQSFSLSDPMLFNLYKKTMLDFLLPLVSQDFPEFQIDSFMNWCDQQSIECDIIDWLRTLNDASRFQEWMQSFKEETMIDLSGVITTRSAAPLR
ncbi:hypothetical protein HMI54_005758 [Coelomomyces lativittatus]|nr:hypothetical protein HMI54_005758 [Coelomomyces lativittatus]KAJ1514537.1 hypothetical protein HMI56_000254 [Coelomomyces lativittatus]